MILKYTIITCHDKPNSRGGLLAQLHGSDNIRKVNLSASLSDWSWLAGRTVSIVNNRVILSNHKIANRYGPVENCWDMVSSREHDYIKSKVIDMYKVIKQIDGRFRVEVMKLGGGGVQEIVADRIEAFNACSRLALALNSDIITMSAISWYEEVPDTCIKLQPLYF